MDVSPTNLLQEERIQEIPNTNDTAQLEIGEEKEGEEDLVEEDLLEDEEKDMLEDKLRERHRVNLVATIANLRMKLNYLFRLQIPLCQMVVMPMVRPTLPCDIDLLEHDFTIEYRDGATVFYVTTTNEAGESL